MDEPADVVDLREAKAEARRLLPASHPVRLVLEREPDVLVGPETAHLAVLLHLILAHRNER